MHPKPFVQIHSAIPNLIIINNFIVKEEIEKHEKEIIIDTDCACAVLRGANIFAPGILGMSSGRFLFIINIFL